MKKGIAFYTLALLLSVTVQAQKGKTDSDPIVLISTSMGDMKVRLYNATPQHRDNFIKLANSNFYDSLLFHRVMRNFMIQGGDPLSKNAPPEMRLGGGDNGYTIPAEFVDTIYHKKGSLCRTENPAKASSGCQFYIAQGQVVPPDSTSIRQYEMQRGIKLNETQKQILTTVGGLPWLDKNYTVFGEVTEGLDVLEKIVNVPTAPSDRPIENVYILKMKVLDK